MLHLSVPPIEAETTDEALQKIANAVAAELRDAAKASAAPAVTAPVTPRRRERSKTMTTTTVVGQSNNPASNIPKLDDLLKDAKELGGVTGRGSDSWGQLLLKVHEASYLGGIDVDANKHGQGTDDATKVAEAYVQGQTGNMIFNAKAPSQKKTISCVRTMIRLGMFAKGGQGEPLATVNQFVAQRQKMRKDPAYAKRLDDVSNSLLRFARAQLKRDSMIVSSEFPTFILKKEHDVPTEEEWLERIRKSTNNAKNGKGGVHVDASVADAIVNACTKRLKAIVASRSGNKAAAV